MNIKVIFAQILRLLTIEITEFLTVKKIPIFEKPKYENVEDFFEIIQNATKQDRDLFQSVCALLFFFRFLLVPVTNCVCVIRARIQRTPLLIHIQHQTT